MNLVLTVAGPLVGILAADGPPLRPGRDEARSWAERELARSDYDPYRPGLLDRFLAWLQDLLNRSGGLGLPWWVLIVVLLAVLAVVVAVAWRRGGGLGRRGAVREADVFAGEAPRSAAWHREAAERAEAAGDWEQAVIERFRAIGRELEERTIVVPRPGRTAHELALEAAPALPERRAALDAAATRFDAVRYGGRHATADQVAELRALDEAVRVERVALA